MTACLADSGTTREARNFVAVSTPTWRSRAFPTARLYGPADFQDAEEHPSAGSRAPDSISRSAAGFCGKELEALLAQDDFERSVWKVHEPGTAFPSTHMMDAPDGGGSERATSQRSRVDIQTRDFARWPHLRGYKASYHPRCRRPDPVRARPAVGQPARQALVPKAL